MSDPDNFLSRWSRRKLEPQDAPGELGDGAERQRDAGAPRIGRPTTR